MKKVIVNLIFVLSLLSAAAAHASKVSIDPAHVRVIALAGESKSGALKVDNPSDR
jgi:hypothetical protein